MGETDKALINYCIEASRRLRDTQKIVALNLSSHKTGCLSQTNIWRKYKFLKVKRSLSLITKVNKAAFQHQQKVLKMFHPQYQCEKKIKLVLYNMIATMLRDVLHRSSDLE